MQAFLCLCAPDVDECALGSDCDKHARCQNTEGSYTCTCIRPYSGDGKNCTGNKMLIKHLYTVISVHIKPIFVFTVHLPVFLPAPVKCENPGSPDFGHRDGSNFLMGGEVVFGCMNAYELVGSPRLRCLETGSWDNPLPYCRGERSCCHVMPSNAGHVLKMFILYYSLN